MSNNKGRKKNSYLVKNEIGKKQLINVSGEFVLYGMLDRLTSIDFVRNN